MSALPSRTRSLRKAGVGSAQNEPSDASFGQEDPARHSHSPSRLPIKPLTTRPTRSISTTTTAAAAAQRPPSATGSTTSNGSMRPPPSRISLSKPTATGGLQRATSIRRANPLSAATEHAEPVKKDRSRPPIVTSRHFRNASSSSYSTSTTIPSASGHARTRSTSNISNTSSALRPANRYSVELPKLHPPPASKRNSVEIPRLQPHNGDLQLKKQAFNTYQQHFSPAKNLAPKPLTAAYLAPPSPSKLPSNIAISAETAKLQNELLQLHLLHRDAAQVERKWKASAKRKLGDRFHAIVDKNERLLQLEVEETGKINAVALKSWQETGTPGWGLQEKIQVLDEIVTGVWNLGESGGKYSRAVRKFERWLRRREDILEARARGQGMDGDEVVFLEELDGSWRADCLAIGRKLEAWRDHLRDLRTPDHGSSLGVTVASCRSLVRGMLAELSTMAQIERDAMRTELEWIKSTNGDVMDGDDDTPVAGAIWRSR